MQAVPINYVAVVLAAVANMILGFVWFGPLFGKLWILTNGYYLVALSLMGIILASF